MSRPRGKNTGLTLPRQLQAEIGLSSTGKRGLATRRFGPGNDRKAQRKAAREEKKQQHSRKRLYDDGSKSSDSIDDAEPIEADHTSTRTKIDRPIALKAVTQPKSILKKPRLSPEAESDDSEASLFSRGSSPELVLDGSSRTFREAAARNDKEIAALEKRLGVKQGKTPRRLEEDGLEDLLEGLDSGDESKKRRREGREWWEAKRRKTTGSSPDIDQADDDEMRLDKSDENDDQVSDFDEDSGSKGTPAANFDSLGQQRTAPNTGFSGLGLDISSSQKPGRVRENPYLPPTSGPTSERKYIPPSLRQRSNADTDSIERLQRQMQGPINKLSEANLLSILKDIEALYQSSARQDVTSTFVELILSIIGNPAVLQPTFVILHAAIVSALYKVIGTDLGAEIVSRLVERLDELLEPGSENIGKACNNFVSFLSFLFIFGVIGSALVFDFAKICFRSLTEFHTELLLRMVRDCGPQLRHDNPMALKEAVQIMQDRVLEIKSQKQEMSVRTKFMIETITDLKNNKMKSTSGANSLAVEHVNRMRKVLGTLSNRTLKATEPLSVTRDDINNSDKRGRWWLVGASWRGNDSPAALVHDNNADDAKPELDDVASAEPDLLALAKHYQMNTGIRRAIFVAIMSANDYQDAHLRLMKLRLKRSQEQEIAKVILRCSGSEQTYNPYYTLVVKRLCSEKRSRMSFQFALWDFFKRMGENGDLDASDDEEEAPNVDLSEIVNLAKMYGALIHDGTLAIGLLKTLNLAYLKHQARMFLELLLVTILGSSSESIKSQIRIKNVFGGAAEAPQIITGLRHFLKACVRKSDLIAEKDREVLLHNCRLAEKALATATIARTLA